MSSVIRWAVKNMAGVNFLVFAVLIGGLFSFFGMRRETFPEFQLEVILVSVPYPGATPDEVESGICQKIEEAVQSLSGIKKLTSICREGSGFTLLQLEPNIKDAQKVLSEVRSAVDRISVFFPERSEKATVEQVTFRLPAIRLAILGPKQGDSGTEQRLRTIAENVRERLIELPNVSQAQLLNVKPYQIDVEVGEDTLRKYGLTLSQVAMMIRKENLETPSGQLKSDGQEILLRGKNKRDFGDDIAKLPLITQPNGVVLTVGDIGRVRDEFDDVAAINEINGRPALVISIERTSNEDLLSISEEVTAFVKRTEMPDGYSLLAWGDESIDVRDRIRMLRENGLQGGIIVFLLLAMFLNLRLAFWVAMGIPISLMGAGIGLYAMGETLNMLTMFAFLMAVGIVVDDGIVIGENIFAHRAMGKSNLQASIDGAIEVLPSVFSSVATTIIAFLPLLYVSGVMGKFIAVMPAAIILMLVISLFEASLALPGHLSHESKPPKTSLQKIQHLLKRPLVPIERFFERISIRCNAALDWFGENFYGPTLKLFLRHPLIPFALGFTVVSLAAGMVRSGVVPFEFFPSLDGKTIIGQVIYPDGTPASITADAARRMEQAIRRISEEVAEREIKEGKNKTPEPLDRTAPRGPVKLTFLRVGSADAGNQGAGDRISGSHVAQVQAEIHDATERNITSDQLIQLWREEAGVFPGAERVTFQAANIGPGGKPLEFKILAPRENVAELDEAVEAAKAALAKYDGVYDIRDDSNPGKTEFQFTIRERAKSLGIRQEDLSEAIRSAYYGSEVMRLQRGRHEVKLMVRHPSNERRSLADFQDLRVRGPDNVERPLAELADIKVTQGYSEINRLDQLRSITVSAELDTTKANASRIAIDLKSDLVPKLLARFPSLRFRWEGQQQETAESFNSLAIGFLIAMLAMYLLLVFEFQSYLQPLIVLAIVPFGMVGAIFGHAIQGLPLTLFSMFGMVTLAGVVVNDSIVMVDFINQCIHRGMLPRDAIITAGSRRLRAVFLTSVTTIAGLLPMLLEKSFQAQALIPMATSLAFGLLGSTLLVLLMVPLLYHFYVLLTFTDEERFGMGVERSDSSDVTAIENAARVDTGGLATSS
ncbi:MAG: efflux RND transporter permease subunit [Planctomycetes bacterium]|nr:efflux RND transporter permease subunit [Planctomycetota bacterium]